ncbi:MAG: tRNA 4-thiouridine(8) synthase ThiI [Clostridia bacterium]|jgi:thiamine biosynthesis protein ThiI|nr:tRNA 4-thiouridine(8) synthase ThiI [Clostridia bacterium]
MKEVILLKYGEIVLKGLNRSFFNTKLESRVRRALKSVQGEFYFDYAQSTLCLTPSDDADVDLAYEKVKKVFGVATVCRGIACEKDMDEITRLLAENVNELLGNAKTFKCEAKRSDKKFALKSPEICAICGGTVLENRPDMKVDVINPERVITIEIRDRQAFIHGNGEKGAGGVPVGSSGRAMLMLSGGIDSPVAGHMIAKRGAAIDAVYFETPPYTGEAAAEKVKTLAEKLTEYCGEIYLHSISLTEIQETLVSTCKEKLFTLLLRRFMVRCASKLGEKYGAGCIITGESLGQVASQTMQSLAVTDAVATLPILRPCIGLDKDEIVVRAREIGTFETSILPYEDCCTVFTPKHPDTRPDMDEILEEEAKLDVDALVERAMATDRYERLG